MHMQLCTVDDHTQHTDLGVPLKYHTYHHNLTLQVAMHPDYFLLVKGQVLPFNAYFHCFEQVLIFNKQLQRSVASHYCGQSGGTGGHYS